MKYRWRLTSVAPQNQSRVISSDLAYIGGHMSGEMWFPSLCWSLSRVWLFSTPWTSPPGSPVLGIFQARILEWVAIPFPRGSSPSRDWIQISCIHRQILYHLSLQESPPLTLVKTINREWEAQCRGWFGWFACWILDQIPNLTPYMSGLGCSNALSLPESWLRLFLLCRLGLVTKLYILNPKAMSVIELYGILDPTTRDWTDGVLSNIFREINKPTDKKERKWVSV